ncbi:MAG: regulatory signaling modulator protein AmpE [Gammaproteobacteria bacterium]|nr:regulatory signaling modulator protein AmpE [Gammaproteobacteria bacterium]MDH5731490.1 regulatory signaling modulator protein AmpE [Gammaproteobacteria bacterium]
MTLISIIFSLLAERFFNAINEYRQFDWFARFVDWSRTKISKESAFNGWLGVIAIVIAIPLVAAFIYHELHDWFYLFGFLFGVVVLLFSLGPQRFYHQIKDFCEVIQPGESASEEAIANAEKLLGREVSEEEKTHLDQAVTEMMLVKSVNSLFGVIFWFSILGPIAALTYRLILLLAERLAEPVESADDDENPLLETSQQLAFYVQWIPVRLLALSYAVAGNFVEGMARFKNADDDAVERWPNQNERLLVSSGLGSLGLKSDDDAKQRCNASAALDLIRRTIALWVGLIALMTLTGWLA